MLVTPFTADYRLNEPALRAEVKWAIEKGAPGVVTAPSIGEFLHLDELGRTSRLKSFQAGDLARAEEIQRRLNRCFPRGGEETLGHPGTTKVTASVVTGIDTGPARPPYMAPEDAAARLQKRLPALLEII
jgi:dihydrodipicolinate synthase/N-acetylneuraminate lyase